MALNLGIRKGWPHGFSSPAPVLSTRWPFMKRFPTVWVASGKCRYEDMQRFADYCGISVKAAYKRVDNLSLVGKAHPDYTTEKREWLKKNAKRLGFKVRY